MPRPRSDIEPRLLAAARARFLAEGVDGASLRSIARDAGTSIGMIYYYFPTKDDLFLAVIEEVYEPFLADFGAALQADVPVEDRLRRVMTRIGQVTDDELTTIRLVVREALVSSDRLTRVLQRFQRGHLPMILATLAEGRTDGTFDPALPPGLEMILTFTIAGLPQLLRRAGDRLPPLAGLPEGQAFTDLLMRVLLRAIGPGSTTP